MNAYMMNKILLLALSFIIGMLISVNWSAKNGISIELQTAQARVGRPLSPGSVAGVHRRHVRRHHYHHHHHYPHHHSHY